MNHTRLFLVYVSLSFLYYCSQHRPRKPINKNNSSKTQNYSIELSKEILKYELNQIQKYADESPNKFQNSKFGFMYSIIEEHKEGRRPKSGDEIIFTYRVLDLQGKIIYDYPEVGEQNILLERQNIILGLNEGIKLMRIKEKAIFLFPSQLAYGFHGDKKKISINEPLVYEVHLKNIRNEIK